MHLQVLPELSLTGKIKYMKSLMKRCSPLPLLKKVGEGGFLRLGKGLFEVSEQHGRHDALLCVDG